MISASIIMPVLNESAGLSNTLERLQVLRDSRTELIVVDGGSIDGSIEIARPYADRVLPSRPGRALQMNAGAAIASGDVLIFLHADTDLPEDAMQQIGTGLVVAGHHWGRFDVRLSGSRWPLRVVELLMNLRSRWSGMVTGDQAMFVRRTVFERVGGYPVLPLMEDLAISKLLRREGRPLCLKGPVITSSRRWEQRGILRTILLMWRLRLAWYFGADPADLARLYR